MAPLALETPAPDPDVPSPPKREPARLLTVPAPFGREDQPRVHPRDTNGSAARARVASAMVAARPELLRWARALARDEDGADDLFQATALRALERAASLREPARPVAWMMRIMRNIHFDGRRRQAGATALVQELPAPGPEPLPRWRQVGDDEVAALVSRLLPEELRLVWHFTQIEKLNQRAVAERLGISRVTVATRVLRVRARLRRALAAGELG